MSQGAAVRGCQREPPIDLRTELEGIQERIGMTTEYLERPLVGFQRRLVPIGPLSTPPSDA
jgi:hypothetical protein